ncbi:MAG: hypothetical protein ACJ0BI_08335 [Paracoccaceae bacterium]
MNSFMKRRDFIKKSLTVAAPVGRDDRLLSIAQELEKVFEFSARPQL